MNYLLKKRCFAYALAPNKQDVPSLTIKDAEIFDQHLPAEECKAFIHSYCGFPVAATGGHRRFPIEQAVSSEQYDPMHIFTKNSITAIT